MLLSQFPERVRARAQARLLRRPTRHHFSRHTETRLFRFVAAAAAAATDADDAMVVVELEEAKEGYRTMPSRMCAPIGFRVEWVCSVWRCVWQWLVLLWKQHCLRTAQLPTRESRAETRARGCRRRRVGGRRR